MRAPIDPAVDRPRSSRVLNSGWSGVHLWPSEHRAALSPRTPSRPHQCLYRFAVCEGLAGYYSLGEEDGEQEKTSIGKMPEREDKVKTARLGPTG